MNSSERSTPRVGNPKDLVSGLVFVAVGLAYAVSAGALDLGSARNMGPGYFPLVLSGLLILIGLIVAGRSFTRAYDPVGRIPIRAVVLVSATPLLLALTLRGLGFVPAVALSALLAALANHEMRWTVRLAVSAGVTVLAVLIFLFGLGFTAQPFGPWLGF